MQKRAWEPQAPEVTRQPDPGWVSAKLAEPALGAGARLLEVRRNVSGEKEREFFRGIMPALAAEAACPLMITADTRSGLEEALIGTPGRPLVAAVWSDRKRLDQLLPLIRRHGAAVVAVCADATKVPDQAVDRLSLAEEMIGAALSAGLRQEDVVLDPAAGPVDGARDGLMVPLHTLALIKEELGQCTLMRLGPLATGLAGSVGLEAACLAMAAAAGLDLVVGAVDLPAMRDATAAASLLVGRDPSGRNYRNLSGGGDPAVQAPRTRTKRRDPRRSPRRS